jgi:hypothetical protein
MRQNKWSRDQRFQDLSDDRVFFDRAWTELTDPCAHSTLQVIIEAHCPTVERQDIEGAAPPDATAEVAEVDGKAEHHRDREWWRKEAARCGSDWAGIARLLSECIVHLEHLIADAQACDVCGQTPCVNPTFCDLSRDIDRRTAGKHRSGNDRLPHDWPDMSLDALWDHFNAPSNEAAKSTYDALFFELSACGLSQLAKSNCQGRLAALSTAQLRTIIQALIRSRAKYPNITDELIAKLGDQL